MRRTMPTIGLLNTIQLQIDFNKGGPNRQTAWTLLKTCLNVELTRTMGILRHMGMATPN